MSNDLQSKAAVLLQNAVQLSNEKKFTGALMCYQSGIQMLFDLKHIHKDKEKYFLQKIQTYLSEAEKIKELISKQKEIGFYHEEIQILDNSRDHGYENILKPFLDHDVTEVIIEDPYLRTHQQCSNLLLLCSVLTKICENLVLIKLISVDDGQCQERFHGIKCELERHNINFEFSFSQFHDRYIRLNNGWVLKLGRGLDFYKNKHKYDLGVFDLDFRACRETSIDVFYKKNT